MYHYKAQTCNLINVMQHPGLDPRTGKGHGNGKTGEEIPWQFSG